MYQFDFKYIKKPAFITIFLVLTAFAWHKYYVSVTEIDVKPDKLEIIIRTFPDDMENILHDNYQIDTDISDKKLRPFLVDYLRSHFELFVNDDTPLEYQFLGATIDDNFLVLLLQANLPAKVQKIIVKNTLLFDAFDEQKNIVHFLNGLDKQSFILVKQDNEAVYSLKK
jgi:hypothetical protein